MGGLFLGGKYIESKEYVDYFLLREDYRYAYLYSKYIQNTCTFGNGEKENCKTYEMIQAAPVILVSWSKKE